MSRIPRIAGPARWSLLGPLLSSLALMLAPSLAQEPAKKDEPKKEEP